MARKGNTGDLKNSHYSITFFFVFEIQLLCLFCNICNKIGGIVVFIKSLNSVAKLIHKIPFLIGKLTVQ